MSQIQFTPLYGTGAWEPVCFLLEIDECRILLDCGWDYRFDLNDIAALKNIRDIDAVLISHSDLLHLGALPFAVAKLGLSCPIYSTEPTWRMGQMYMYDAYQDLMARTTDFGHFTIDDVDTTFENFIRLKYSQDMNLGDRGKDITVTPFASGNMLGGTIWRISKETENIIYAIDYNHKRERHLNRTVLESFERPTVLITDALNYGWHHKNRKKRDSELIEKLMSTLRDNGNVLMPTDTAGRVLELLLILHQHWTVNKLSTTYSLVYLANTAKHTIGFANSMIEWMSDGIQRQFDTDRANPFSFENLRIVTKKSDLDRCPRPMVVLASNAHLAGSFAQDLVFEWLNDPKSMILFTQRAPENTVAGKLLAKPTPKVVEITTSKKIALSGEELEEFLIGEKAKKDQEALDKKDDSDDESAMVEEILDDDEVIYDPKHRRRIKLAPQFPMFPFVEEKTKHDVYGEIVDTSKYMGRADEEDGMEIEDLTGTKNETKPITDSSNSKKPAGKKSGGADDDKTPKKTVIQTRNHAVRCRIHYIDFEGRSDGRSIETIISHVQPRKLILVHGSEKSKNKLKKYCEKNVCEVATNAQAGQCVDITSDTSVYKVVLKDNFEKSLDFLRVGNDYEVAYMDAIVTPDSSYSGAPILERAPEEKVKGHPAVFLGEIRLVDVQNALTYAGIHAEFYPGVLVCGKDGIVNIRKSSSAQISVQGALCEDYFKIREILYSQFQII